ncbi:MAG: PAS domain S-box protein [Rubrivivax sp.]|nr:PAS domain S-box protein [Rubrivivax sp.]
MSGSASEPSARLELPVVPGGPATPRSVLPGPWLPPLAAALGAAAYAVIGQGWHEGAAGWLLGALLVAALCGLLARTAAELAALRQLEQGIHNAREGLLTPTAERGVGWTSVGRLIPEHNTTVAALAMMFRTVEECQTRFLDERNRLNAILQSTPGALLGITDDLTIAIANRRAEALFGAGGGSIVERGLFELLVLDERGRNVLRDAFLYKLELHDQELELTVGGEVRAFNVNLAFYSDEQDDMGGVMIMQDVTERRQLMQTVAMREKFVAMGQLAAGVAHELNTPLGNILGYAQLLTQEVGDRPKVAGYAEVIAAQSQRASRVVQDLLSYARKDQCSGETCAVNIMVQELIDAFIHCRLRRYGIEVDLRLAPENPLAEGGCGEVDIVFTNIISNAIQALARTPQPRIEVATWREGGLVAIAVADNGPGVPPEVSRRLFDPFFSTKEVGQGSGLGLFISQALVTRRGGRIDYDAGHAPGARFVIRLPAVEPERIAAAAA